MNLAMQSKPTTVFLRNKLSMANSGIVYRSIHWAKRKAQGCPIRKVNGGWMVCKYSKKRRRNIRCLKSRRVSGAGEIKPIFTINF